MTDPHDLLAIDAELTAEERALRDTVGRFLDDRVRPHVASWWAEGRLPREIAGELGRLGLLGMHLAGYGCAGAGAVAYGVACRELEACDSGLRSLVSVQGSLAMTAIHRHGTEEQKQRWLPGMATGELIGCFGLTEPDAGSDPAGMRTRARRDGPDWIIDGTKMWITNGGIADVAVVWARTDDGVRGFAVPTDVRGFSTRPVGEKLSLRASITSELLLEGCRLPEETQLPGARGLGAPLACLNEARYGIIWGAVGAARDCFLTALRYSKERVQFDRPIAGFQLTQAKLAAMAVDLSTSALLAQHLGRLKEAGTLRPEQVSLGKL
ncbi:MAG: acyl-CoA dehydrogenase, partial [Micromonosporaceae bacterium]|nr:acyl-CoA dehydrogenase [Micromonosporaceae bacterium]